LVIVKHSSFESLTDLDALQTLLQWFDGFQSLPISKAIWMQCQLALIEGFTNAVRHAHHGLPDTTPIRVEAIATQRFLDLKIWDWGPGFDFSDTLRHRQIHTDENSEGGRGLRIMERIADELHYTRHADGRNCLHIRKYFKQPITADGVRPSA
jgi:serine/threonine-protein kinase RsbW